MARPFAVVVAIAAVACRGERRAPEMPASGAAAVKAMAPDTMVRRMDSAAAARAAENIAPLKKPKNP
jgi:hypothetical protein